MRVILYRNRKFWIIVGIVSLLCFDSKNVSIVYNMRISEVTQRFDSSSKSNSEQSEDKFTSSITLIDQVRRTYNDIKQNNTAAFLTFLYNPSDWFIRAETAFGHVKNTFPTQVPVHLVQSITQMDDILVTSGYTLKAYDNKARITMSGVLGIPVHPDVGLLGAQFGTGHVSVGTRLDGSYAYADNTDHMLIGASRYIRFISRNADVCSNQRLRSVDVALGNLLDILLGTYHEWGRHQLAAGYNATFAFGAHIDEPAVLVDFEEQAQFIRSAFYAAYGCRFPIGHHQSGITIGFSYSFDHRPISFGFERMESIWLTWGIQF